MNNLIKTTFLISGLICTQNVLADFTSYDLSYGPESWIGTGDEYEGTNFWSHRYYNFSTVRDECDTASGGRGCEYNTATHSGVDFAVPGDEVFSYGFGRISKSTPDVTGQVSIRHLVNTGQYFQVNLLHSSGIDTNIVEDNYIVKKQFIGIKDGIGSSGTRVFPRHLHFEVSDATNITTPLTEFAHPGPGELRPSIYSKAGLTAHYTSTDTDTRYYNPNAFAAEKSEALPFLSSASLSPSELNYDVYGIADENIFGSLDLTGTFDSSSIVVRNFFTRNRVADRGGLNDADTFLGGRNLNSAVTGITGNNAYSEGDYLFVAYVNDDAEDRFGYPVKFSFVKDGDIIVDNDQQITSSVESNYNDLQSEPAYHGSDAGSKVPGYFLTATLQNGQSNTFAQWRPYQRGEYEIYVHIPEYGATATNVSYKIVTESDSFVLTKPIDQSLHAGEWVRLSTDTNETFKFNDLSYVELSLGAEVGQSNSGIPAGKKVAFDAVKFVQVTGVIRAGFDVNTLAANDDGSTGLVDLGFSMNYFGNSFSQGYVNNNGNMTFDSPLSTYTPFGLSNANRVIIAPFFADVDTSIAGSSPVTYGQGDVGSRPAFAANWVNVACFATPSGGYNSFQMVLIDRSDVGAGDFDIEFNYEVIDWETGQASGGNSLCEGGNPVRVGYSNGTSTSFELAGSGVSGAFLDTNLETGLIHNNRNTLESGRYLFEVRNGDAPTGHHIAGTVFSNDVSSPLASSLIQICTDGLVDLRCNLTRSNTLGQYLIDGLTDGSYEVTAFPPASSNYHTAAIGPIVLAGVNLNGQDIILQGPQPLPPNTVLTPSRSNNFTGEPTIYWNDTITLNTQGCPGGIASYTVVHNDTGLLLASGAMQEDPANLGNYTGEIAPLAPNSGHATVTIEVNCPDGSREDVIFSMYIDPSGVVVDTRGNPVSNATVQLYRSGSSAGPFELVPNGSDIMSPTNRTNPDLTNEQGLFGWDVITGFYIVRAEATDCTSPDNIDQSFVETETMSIPPEVTDLRLVLDCITDTDGDGVDDDVDNCPVTINPDQSDNDNDGEGDVCDADDDNDSVLDTEDNCQLIANTDQADLDGDGIGNICDSDLDGDGIVNDHDNCTHAANPDQADFDRDGQGDTCDMDDDGDSVQDAADMCPQTVFPENVLITNSLGKNRWALSQDGNLFFQAPPQSGSKSQFSIADTGGCNCAQLVGNLGVGKGHLKYGCSTGVMLKWTSSINVD